jgi:hypothetical protein
MNQILHISLPEKVYSTLERAAKTTMQPLEKIAAEWLEQIADVSRDSLDEFVGSFASGIKDAADQHDKYLGETLAT